jgi:phosphatidylinositol alpha-mannosyltransferase
VRALGKVDDEHKREELLRADVLCAPSLGGESFGMVLTEAFAAGTPVIASDIPGYRAVVDDGVNGVLVPVGDPVALAEALRDMYHEPERRQRLARAAAAAAKRFAWERVATEVMAAYQDAIEMPRPAHASQRAGIRFGLRPADLRPKVPAQRLQGLEATPERAPRDKWSHIRRGGMIGIILVGLVLGVLALRNIGVSSITRALISSSPAYVLLGLATMCTAMAARGVGWFAILKAALPRARIRLSDAMQGTFIGVLMSSTLPARLGEPARALVVARRTGQPRENLPAVLGTVVSQTLLNILALAILGGIMFSAVDVFSGHEEALLIVAAVPIALLTLVLLAPLALRHGLGSASDSKLRQTIEQVSGAMVKVRDGLAVFRQPRLGGVAAGAQLAAWAIQSLSCYLLLLALGLGPRTGIAAAAGVLFAVNVTAVLPATPANVGVFQAACAAVLHAGWHIPWGTGVAYGVILQAVEVTTAVLMGMPALLREGMSWREVRMRAMHAAPVRLAARPAEPLSSAQGPMLSQGSQL